jgi:hypothetical protein
MTSGHRENMRCSVDQRRRQRLTAKVANIDPFIRADLNGIQARRLSSHGVHSGGSDFNVVAMSDESLEKPFRDWAPTNITRADEENTFHDARRAN